MVMLTTARRNFRDAEAGVRGGAARRRQRSAIEDGKANYRAEIGSLASSGAEMLVVLAYVDGSGQTIVRQALEGGDFAKFAGGDGMIGDSLVTAIGEGKLDGFIGTKIGRSETPGTAMYADMAKAAGLDPAASFAWAMTRLS